jgi:hypothetical protein
MMSKNIILTAGLLLLLLLLLLLFFFFFSIASLSSAAASLLGFSSFCTEGFSQEHGHIPAWRARIWF